MYARMYVYNIEPVTGERDDSKQADRLQCTLDWHKRFKKRSFMLHWHQIVSNCSALAAFLLSNKDFYWYFETTFCAPTIPVP
jgi:hypothetical protein